MSNNISGLIIPNNDISNKSNITNNMTVSVEENSEQFQLNQERRCPIDNCINDLDKFDKMISKPLHTYSPSFRIEIIFFCFARLFNIDTIIIYLISILLYCFWKYKNGYLIIIPLCHILSGVFFTVLLKKIFNRSRPTLNTRRYFKLKESNKSMPSGDSMQAGIFAIMIILYIHSPYSYLSLLIIPCVMAGRIFYNLHYWFDCIIGAIIGIFSSLGTYKIIHLIKEKYQIKMAI